MGIVVVTGTSKGIGQATAITLARAGHSVFAGMRSLDRGDELRAVASKEKLPISIVQLDVEATRPLKTPSNGFWTSEAPSMSWSTMRGSADEAILRKHQLRHSGESWKPTYSVASDAFKQSYRPCGHGVAAAS